jgi:hypothetical protein
MPLIYIPQKHLNTVLETLRLDADSGNFDPKLRRQIAAAEASIKLACPQVRIDVSGGVAYVGRCSRGVRVKIVDHDNR